MKTRTLSKYGEGMFLLNLPLAIHTVLSLVTLPIIVSSISAADYGRWQFVLALQVWGFALTADNITRATKRGIATGLDGTFIHGFLARTRFVIPLALVLIAVAFYVFIVGDKVIAVLLAVLSSYLPFACLFQVTSFEYLIAKKEFKYWSVWQIMISAVSLSGSALLAYLTRNVIYIALVQLGTMSLISVCLWVIIVRRDGLLDSYRQKAIDKDCVSYGIKLIPVELMSAAANKISYFIIAPYFGFSSLALFSVADKLRERSIGILRSFRPLLYADFARASREDVAALVNRNLFRLFIVGMLIAAAFLVGAWFYIQVFLPMEFRASFGYFAILVLGVPAVLMAVVLHTSLEAHLRYKELTVVGLIPNVLKVLLVILGGCLGGILGICVGLTIGLWVSLFFYYLLTLRLEYVQRVVRRFPYLMKLSDY